MTAVGELLTPTATVAGAWPPNTPEWYAVRRTGIGSSDVAPILGYSSHRSAAHVWADKRGELQDDQLGEEGRWGQLLEDVVAREWANRHGLMVAAAPTLRNTEHPHRLASVDRFVVGCDDAGCVLEVKTRSAYVAGSWREDVPDDVLAQCQWQLLVTGLQHVHVACLVGGQRLVEHTVYPEPAVLDYVAAEADAVWECVQSGVRPHVDSARLLLDLLDRLHPDRAGHVEIDPVDAARLRADYDLGKQMENAGKQEAETAKAALVALLGAGDTATVDGLPVATYKSHDLTTLDRDRLRKEFPAAWAACARTKPTRPVLRWK